MGGDVAVGCPAAGAFLTLPLRRAHGIGLNFEIDAKRNLEKASGRTRRTGLRGASSALECRDREVVKVCVVCSEGWVPWISGSRAGIDWRSGAKVEPPELSSLHSSVWITVRTVPDAPQESLVQRCGNNTHAKNKVSDCSHLHSIPAMCFQSPRGPRWQ